MKKCKWAGDVNDEYCKGCNGETLMFEGKEKSCTECAGYEAGEEETADEVAKEEEYVEEKKKEEPIMNPPVEDEPKKEIKKTSTKKETTVTTKNKDTEEPKVTTNIDKKQKSVESSGNNVKSTVKSIRVMSGVTREVNGTYYKFTYEQENELYPGLTEEEVAEEKEKLWAIANAEVDKQLEDVLK